MAYSVKSKKSGNEYFLHARPAKNGNSQLYFFAKEIKPGAQEALPAGYEVAESPATGLPLLKKTR